MHYRENKEWSIQIRFLKNQSKERHPIRSEKSKKSQKENWKHLLLYQWGGFHWLKKKKRPDYKVGRILLYLAHTELIFLITSTNQYEKGEHPNRNKSREL